MVIHFCMLKTFSIDLNTPQLIIQLAYPLTAVNILLLVQVKGIRQAGEKNTLATLRPTTITLKYLHGRSAHIENSLQ